MNFFKFKAEPVLLALGPELNDRHEQDLKELIPVAAPPIGFLVVAFAGWDFLVDPSHAALSALLRIVFVMIGAIAYWPTKMGWSVKQRAHHIYWTHSAGVILATFTLEGGIAYGLVGIVVGIVSASMVQLQTRQFFVLVLPPYVLFVVCAAIRMSGFAFFNTVALYGLGVGIALVQMYIFRYMRIRSLWLEHQLAESASHDPLTGCLNRGRLKEIASREIALCRRRGCEFAVAMLDIDHFKAINDGYGHDAGDMALKALAKTCSAQLRETDYFVRLGGEEFVCLLPDADLGSALTCAERLRTSVEALTVHTEKGVIRFTISIGVAVLQPGRDSWEEMLKNADEAMYAAKKQGRNRVVTSVAPDMPAASEKQQPSLAAP